MRRDEGNEVSNWCGEDMDYSELFPRVSKLMNVWGYSKVATPTEEREREQETGSTRVTEEIR
jgi:hypothetical protein